MKSLCLLAFAASLWAQTAPPPPAPTLPNLPDNTVIASFADGTQYTMEDFKKLYAVLPPQNQQSALKDPAEALHQWAMLRKLTKMADEKKIAEQSPYKEAIEWSRMQVLASAMVNDTLNAVVVEPAEIDKYYENNKARYGRVKVKAIYISFSTDGSTTSAAKGKKPLTEAEALGKATRLLAEIRKGADFVKLVKENSDDETSRDKDGDYPMISYTDNIPDAFRASIFKLKQGELSDPVRQVNGYYILRAEEVNYKPLSELRNDILEEIKNQRLNEWMKKLNGDTMPKVNPAFAPEKK